MRTLKDVSQCLPRKRGEITSDFENSRVLETDKGRCQDLIDDNGPACSKGSVATLPHNTTDFFDSHKIHRRTFVASVVGQPVQFVSNLYVGSRYTVGISTDKQQMIIGHFQWRWRRQRRRLRALHKDLTKFSGFVRGVVSKTVHRFILIILGEDMISDGQVLDLLHDDDTTIATLLPCLVLDLNGCFSRKTKVGWSSGGGLAGCR
mmetsp:Transcript_24753/g.42126  ORF Transcript_24753/g.42126 Transcript_24753/m.42126 type:complete len:205 (-) Transcript_24753:851-1465(-)